jgi:Dolichyl-phosphate-mannose-protein mannosyltransferase
MSQLLLERVTDEPAAVASAAAGRDRWRHRGRWILAGIVAFGAGVRAIGFSSLGLWRDDAWAALSSRVGLGTALHMGETAPGFYLVERSWILLHPGSTWWAQLLPYLLGVLCIPAIYLVARFFGQRVPVALLAAFVTSVSPVCVTYSTRIKEYQADFLLSCLLLVVGEAVRRQPGVRRWVALVGCSVLGLFVSASVAPVIIGVWLGVVTIRSRRVITAAAATGGGCLLVAALFYRHVSPSLHAFWAPFYLHFNSFGGLLASLYESVLHLEVLMVGGFDSTPTELVLFFLAVTALIGVGLFGGGPYRGAGLVLGAALVSSALGLVPLGTGRTDEVLYPAVLLLIGSGLGRLAPRCLLLLATRRSKVMASLVMAGLLCVPLVSNLTLYRGYPGVDVKGLAAKVTAQLRPGDHIVVNELMRYSWALYEDPKPHLRFGPAWSTGFTVVSTQATTLIAPSEYYEGDSHPEAWARSLASYRRLWFVETAPLSLSPLYAALRHDGWREVRQIKEPGCAALLLER